MANPGIEYILRVWKEKPTDLSNPSEEYWRAHVTGAPGIPRMGEVIHSSGGLEAFNRFRVFEVRYRIGPQLSQLVNDRRSELKETGTPEGEKGGLPLILAYAEQDYPLRK